MLEKLSSGLKDALRKLAGKSYIDKAVLDELSKDIEKALLSGDVDVKLAKNLTQKIRERAEKEKPPAGSTAREHVIKVVYEELVKFVGEKSDVPLKQTKILLAGLFGSGKTTTAAKLAKFYQKRGLRPALIACDVTRPAAYEQLQQLAEQLHVPFYGEKTNKIASEIAKNGMQKVKADIYIFDSSGRNALDQEMIAEIRAINAVVNPQEKILVIPADIGQAAHAQAKGFQDALGITGVIITKMDGTAKAGGALTACSVTGAQVKWIGTGEKVDALERFDPDRFVSKLIGWGDIQGLVEKAKEAIEPEKAEKMAEKLMEGKFTLADFLEQIKAMQKMGSLSSILGNIPGMSGMKLPAGMDLGKQEDKMKRWKFAIESMTVKEKEEPSLLDASRVKRISKGSGVTESEIRELIKQYEQSKKMMKTLGGGGMRRGPLAKLAKKFGGR